MATSPTMPPMRTTLALALIIALGACGDDGDNNTIDAPPPIDAAIDAGRPVLALTPQAYCDTIMANCTGANAQYPSMAQCLATAAGFTLGAASTEMAGDTLGCRIYHAQNAMVVNDPVTHCPHAGPAGAKVDAAAGVCSVTPCEAFCNLNAKTCGTDAAPITGVTNRYASVDACKTACGTFSKVVQYTLPVPNANTMACRVFHLTNAALYKAEPNVGMQNTHCGHTLATPTGVCVTPP
jgi:hypothetical protein